MKNLIITLTVLIGCCYVTAVNYCDKSLCPFRGPHIACGNNGRLGPNCAPGAQAIDLSRLKSLVVDEHNKLRNKIALGQQRSFNSAAKMATMQWDDELAQLAILHVKQCERKHDKCHNTQQFKNSGQNLAYWDGSTETDIKEGVAGAIADWYDEYKNADSSIINKLSMSSGRGIISHFTTVVYEKNYKVGCAALKAKRNGMFEYLVTCNYAYYCMLDQPVYVSGAPASQCKTGRNPNYQGLCSINEKYNL